MVRAASGGILGALRILIEHEGAVGRDLAAAHWTWADVWSETLPFDQFVQFVVFAPPGTAVFHKLNQGWTTDTHKITDLIELTKMLVCANAEDPKSAYEKFDRDWRPGDPIPGSVEQPEQMTIADYMKLAGLTMTEEV